MDLTRRAERVLLLSSNPVAPQRNDLPWDAPPDRSRVEFPLRISRASSIGSTRRETSPTASRLSNRRQPTTSWRNTPRLSLSRSRTISLSSGLIREILDRIDQGDIEDERFTELIRRARVHLGETYRLHRRVLARRDSPLVADFPVRGRQAPEVLSVGVLICR